MRQTKSQKQFSQKGSGGVELDCPPPTAHCPLPTMLIGFEKQKSHFQRLVAEGRLSHAYLFSGPSMIGKRFFGMWLAELINGRPPLMDQDVRILEAQIEEGKIRGIPIDSVRELRGYMSLKPAQGPRKIVLIDGAERLTEDASNALLKLLEEPPAYSLFILISSRPNDVLPTIRSRCLSMKFLPHPAEAIQAVVDEYEIKSSDAQLVTLLADGRIGWVMDVLENKKLPSIKKQLEEFQNVLKQGTAERIIYAKKIMDDEAQRDLPLLWMRWIRAYGKNPDKTRTALSRLLKLHALLDQPQFLHRLALENFLINL